MAALMAGQWRKLVKAPKQLGPHADRLRQIRPRYNQAFAMDLKRDLEAALYGDLQGLPLRQLRALANRINWHRRWESMVGPLADVEQWKRANQRLKAEIELRPDPRMGGYTTRRWG